MLQQTSRQIRRTALCAATAFALCLPVIASAGPLDKPKKKVNGSVVHVGKIVKKANAKVSKKGPASLPGSELLDLVKQLHLTKQLQNTVALMQEMNADYAHFSGGGFGCKGECKAFRANLKGAFDDFLLLVEDVPVLNNKPGLFDNIDRISGLIDYLPPRALYLMWQALDARMDEVRMAAGNIRTLLASLPPLDEVVDISTGAAMTAGQEFCKWADKDEKPFIDLVQAELERLAWVLKTVDGFIPDVVIKAEVGVEGGAVVVNASASAAAGLQPTDIAKIALKAIATIPEAINWSIRLNMLRAKLVCQVVPK